MPCKEGKQLLLHVRPLLGRHGNSHFVYLCHNFFVQYNIYLSWRCRHCYGEVFFRINSMSMDLVIRTPRNERGYKSNISNTLSSANVLRKATPLAMYLSFSD